MPALEQDFESFNINDVSDSDADDREERVVVSDGPGVTSDHSATTSDAHHHQSPSAAAPASFRAGFRQPAKRKSTDRSPSGRKQLAKDVHHFLQEDPKDPTSRFCTLCL